MIRQCVVALLALVALNVVIAQQQGGQQGQDPPFLQGASDSVKSSFRTLFQNSESMTEKQMDDKVNAWVGQQSQSIQSAYKQFKQQMDQMKAQAKQQHQQAVQGLSAAAKKADQDLTQITDNTSLTMADKNKQIGAYLQNLQRTNPSAAQEIQRVMQMGGPRQ
ncbi:unnamed protein product, partial [Mesorhabditis spiculigera]